MAIDSHLPSPRKLTRGLLESSFMESLVSPNPIERYVGMFDPTWSRRDVRAEIVQVDKQTPRSATLTLRPNSNWGGFEAGQHIGLTVEIDGVLTTRFYSPAGSATADDGTLELTITAHPGGKVSEFLVENAHPGMVLGLLPAEGDFVVPAERPDELLLISGGSGITPVMSILRTLCDEGHGGRIRFVHYARTKRDAIYQAELEALSRAHDNLEVFSIFTRSRSKKSVSGHLTKRQLKVICPEHSDAETFVCGPNALVEAAERLWQKDSIEHKLHTEPFTLPEPIIVTEDAVGTVSFARSEIEVENDGQSLLVQAEAGGLSPKHGCRMGICHTCTCRVETGTVRHVRTGDVRTVDNELIQICVNAPIGDLRIDL